MTARDRRLADGVTKWFDAAARDFPWRRCRTPYTALVAEAMLQQTQAARVVEPFTQFLARFPTVEDLAAADEQEVLALWQGLGYYRRARHLHGAAKMILEQYGGAIPADVSALMTLPGVGRYTAGSISSIVFGRREPIVDGNVQRVSARWEADDGDANDRSTVARTWDRAAALVAAAPDPGKFNEGMMELGATICTPMSPRCDCCPVAGDCQARRHGREGEIPPPKRLPRQQVLHFHTVVIDRCERILLEQRGPDGLWSGLWQTPTVEAGGALRPRQVERRLPLAITSMSRLAVFEHRTSHRRITFHVFRARTRRRRGTWREMDDLRDLPMSNAMRRVLAAAQEGMAD